MTDMIMPYVILGDEAFSLHENLMKPYPKNQSLMDKDKSIYNYRHSRARRTTENAVGIMAAYFRIFFQLIVVNPQTIGSLITTSCILHNILRNSKIPLPNQADVNSDVRCPHT